MDREILQSIGVDRVRTAQQFEPRQRAGRPAELLAGLVEMVRIEVAVAPGPDEDARLEPALLGEHMGQQGIACDVEGDTEKDVAAALVELEVEPPARDLGL